MCDLNGFSKMVDNRPGINLECIRKGRETYEKKMPPKVTIGSERYHRGFLYAQTINKQNMNVYAKPGQPFNNAYLGQICWTRRTNWYENHANVTKNWFNHLQYGMSLSAME